MKRVLIDCDPGTADALAVLLASCCKDLDLVAITTSYGVCDSETACRNACSIAELLHLDIPVAQGAERPLFVDAVGTYCGHDTDDLHELITFKSTIKPTQWAWDVIYREAVASHGELTILTMGPLTNLAIALFRYENLPHYIKQIVMLGGSATIGDVTEFGEFNVVNDPHACAAVFQSGIPVTMLGLDVCNTLAVDNSLYLFLMDVFPPAFQRLLSHCRIKQTELGESQFVLPGTALIATSLRPEIAKSVMRSVRVETVRSGMMGRTVVDIRRHSAEIPNVEVITAINKQEYHSEMKLIGAYIQKLAEA